MPVTEPTLADAAPEAEAGEIMIGRPGSPPPMW